MSVLYAITSRLGLTFLRQGLAQGFLSDILHVKNKKSRKGIVPRELRCSLRIVARTEIIVAYPIGVGLSFLSLSIFSVIIGGARITPTQVVGMAAILGGIGIATR